jgi:5-methylcytosine-specific restriction endonuclease McrA
MCCNSMYQVDRRLGSRRVKRRFCTPATASPGRSGRPFTCCAAASSARPGCSRASRCTRSSRDRHVCAYCGGRFHFDELTREHIRPVSRGGVDSWMNCITACRACNGHKGNRLPEEAHMSLLYLPYVPSLHEDMILRGRRILTDQMDFLLASVPRGSRLHG